MITLTEFSAIFKGTDFAAQELEKFYYSVKKSVILRLVGRRSWPEIFTLEENCQWPVLKLIGDPRHSIYDGADKILLDRFIATISEEKNIRERKSSLGKVRYWTLLQSVINERIDLFTQIFGFSQEDVRHCEMVAERYSYRLDRRIKDRKKLWKIGVGTGAATLAGAAALWYLSQKDKK